MIFNNMSTSNGISKQYEKIRLDNKKLQAQREDEIYTRFPRIKQIDDEIADSRFSLIRAHLQNKDTDGKLANEVNENCTKLKQEKLAILSEAGYPADYMDSIYTCKICEDTGYTDGKRCSCFNTKLVNILYDQSNLKKILERENFSTFSTTYYSKEPYKDMQFTPYDNICKIIEKSKLYIEEFNKGFPALTQNSPSSYGSNSTSVSIRPNILFYGETGLGKTFISNCIAKELLDSGHSVLYLSATDLLENVIGNYIINKDSSLEEIYKLVYNCELLIIDDLGTEFTNSFVLTQLFEIINKRDLSEKSTIISTNLSIQELSNRYSQRITSRIIANYTVFNIYGDNIRYQKRANTINSNV